MSIRDQALRTDLGFVSSPAALIGTSSWIAVTQERINRFASATDDFQFIHVDPERAGNEGPFGGTVAHGFLTLSLVNAMAMDVMSRFDSFDSAIIAKVDRVKFLAPVMSGQRIRGHFTFDRLLRLAPHRSLLKVQAVIEIEKQTKHAMTCDVSWVATKKILPETR